MSSTASPADYMEGLVTGYSGTSLTLDASRVAGAGTFANWSINLVGEPGATGSGTGDLLSTNNLSDVPDKEVARANLGGTTVGKALFTATDAAAAQTAIGASTVGKALMAATDAAAARGTTKAASMFAQPGCGRLTKSGANLLFTPYKGNKILINSVEQTIPDAGVTLAPPATSGTLYYIYAYMVSSTLTLEASTTGHATQAGTGIEIKSGDATRTFIGWARTVSSAWIDSLTQRFVISYYNRRPLPLKATNATDLSGVTSTTAVEIFTTLKVEFIATGDDAQWLSLAGSKANTVAPAITYTHFGVDGAAVAAPGCNTTS